MRKDEFPLIDEIRAEDRAKAYKQGYCQCKKDILGTVEWIATEDIIRRKINISIDFDDSLDADQIVRIICEQVKEKIKEQKNG